MDNFNKINNIISVANHKKLGKTFIDEINNKKKLIEDYLMINFN